MPSSSRAIIHPAIDPWLVGGLSIVVLGGFMLWSASIPRELILGDLIVLTVLLNGTHFMASYALLYSSREYIQRYKGASIYMPIGLGSAAALGLWGVTPPRHDATIITGILITASLYLALHYTGQVWGMMSSYAFLRGVRFSSSERKMLRGCLRTLALWQMGWALTSSPSYIPDFAEAWAPVCMQALHVLALSSLCIGSATLFMMSRRLSIRLPISMVLPYASLHVWYLFLYVFPQSIFWVQIFHALQYLSFPARVEINRSSGVQGARNTSEAMRHLFWYCGGLALSSLIVFVGINRGLNYPDGGFEVHWLVICSMINIHHYFIDGCIWHISNPTVRDELFSHLRN